MARFAQQVGGEGGKDRTYPEGRWEQTPPMPSGSGLRSEAATEV